jgi:hypothetical protein
VTVLNDANLDPNVQVIVAPPTIYLIITRDHLRKDVEVAAQNVYDKPEGAYTGEVAVSQLLDSNVHWVILGHSERRQILGETDAVLSSPFVEDISLTWGSLLLARPNLPSMEVLVSFCAVEKVSRYVVLYVSEFMLIP